MPCYHPMHIYIYGPDFNGKFHVAFRKKIIVVEHQVLSLSSEADIPCGKCVGCSLDYSKDWATRLMLELSTSINGYFVTLTYDDSHLPVNESLVASHVFNFIKALRMDLLRHNVSGLRFYAVGEYGSKSLRPHYHLIIYNCPLKNSDISLFDDCNLSNLDIDVLQKRSFDGSLMFSSQYLSRFWKNGFNCVGEVNLATCSYVARYCLKKKASDPYVKKLLLASGRLPEFARMSTHPGIGFQYFSSHNDIYKTSGTIFLPGGRSVGSPRYFDKKMEVIDPELLEIVKTGRINYANLVLELASRQFGISDRKELMKYQEKLKVESIKRLKRII